MLSSYLVSIFVVLGLSSKLLSLGSCYDCEVLRQTALRGSVCFLVRLLGFALEHEISIRVLEKLPVS